MSPVPPAPAGRLALPPGGELARGAREAPRRRRILALWVATAGVLVAGCLASPAKDDDPTPVIASVSGVAMYLQRIGLPAGATVTAQVIEASGADAIKPVIGEQVQKDVRQLPVRFRIEFDLKKTRPEATYLVQVAVHDGARILLVNRGVYPVITRGYPTDVEVLLEEAPQ